MRFGVVRTIYLKELREALRDRRTFFMMVVLPLVLYPALMILMSRLQESQQETQKARASEIAVWGSLPARLESQLTSKSKIVLKPWAEIPAGIKQQLEAGQLAPPPKPEEVSVDAEDRDKPKKDPATPVFSPARSVILARKVDAIVVAWPGLDAQLKDGKLGQVSVLFDSVRPESVKARDRLNEQLRLFRRDLLAEREKQRGLDKGFTEAMDWQTNNVAPPSRTSGMMLGTLLPYMLILFSAMSGFYAAIDMTAGEKERGTMQTLLCAPLTSLEIVSGKFGAIWTISLIATAVNLASLASTFSRIKMPGVSVEMPLTTYLMVLPMVLPVTLLVTSVMLAIGAFARDFKEGQNYLTPVLMGLIFPLMATMSPGVELNSYLAFAPIVNVALLIKSIFLGEWKPDAAFLVMTSSLTYAMLGVMFAANVFARNNLLLGGKEAAGDLLDFSRRPGSKPTPAFSIVLFCLILVLMFYGSLGLADKPMKVILLVTQIGFMLLPSLLLIGAKGFSFKDTLQLRMPGVKTLLGAVLVGLTGWTFAAGAILRLLPPPESLTRAMQKVLMVEEKSPEPIWLVLLLVGVLPGICEETLFRGAIQSGLRRMGMWPAIVVTALLFGVAHASIYRMGPVTFLGMLFCWMAWKSRSIVPGMIAHSLNNGFMVVVSRERGVLEMLGIEKGVVFLPWNLIAVGTVILALGLWLVWSDNRERQETLRTEAAGA